MSAVIVACPACSTRFKVDPALLGSTGRNVRCAKCNHGWRQMPEGAGDDSVEEPISVAEATTEGPPEPAVETPEPASADAHGTASETATEAEPEAEPEEETEPEDMKPARVLLAGLAARPAPPPEIPRRSGYLTLSLVIGMFIGLLVAGYVFRHEIARIPGAEAIYTLLGISVGNAEVELDLANIRTDIREEDGRKQISITGVVFNPTDYPLEVPPLRAVALDSSNRPLEPTHTFRLPEKVIEPGQNIEFRTLFRDLPPETTGAAVSFGGHE